MNHVTIALEPGQVDVASQMFPLSIIIYFYFFV